ncbi:MAG: CPBP family intramembrane metalloprotease [Planctomycetes bacterium]|nr:CPBP family intramembrane metalloprotease [Planctomycetota bacterium]
MADAESTPRGYWQQSRDLLNGLVLALPLLLIYQAGLFFYQGKTANGADLTLLLVRQFGWQALLWFNGALIVGGVVAVFALKRKHGFNPKILLPVALESLVYALLLGTAITWLLRLLPGFESLAAAETPSSPLARICVSFGAGVNEEFVFRLGMFAGGGALIARTLKPENKAAPYLIACLVSSVLFSLAHYMGSEQFALYSFAYRFLAGVMFCALFWGRGFAVAVYTHAIYDVLVLVLYRS